MIVDTSALIGILFYQPEARQYMGALMINQHVRVSAVETAIVTIRRVGIEAEPDVVSLFEILGIEAVSFGSEQIKLAQEAFRTYGKGRHEAALNFGDCFTYALTKATGEPLLYKGSDFARTDIVPALA